MEHSVACLFENSGRESWEKSFQYLGKQPGKPVTMRLLLKVARTGKKKQGCINTRTVT